MVRLNVQPPRRVHTRVHSALKNTDGPHTLLCDGQSQSNVWSVLLDQQNKYFVNFGTVQQQFSTSKTGRILPGRCHHRLAAAEERPPLEGIRQVYTTFNLDDKEEKPPELGTYISQH